MSDYWSETVRRIGSTHQSLTFVEVGPLDVAKCVGIYTTNEQSELHFGKLSVQWPPEFARRVALAILACCDELEKP